MSPRFLKMIPFLWEWEGTKLENDPDDPGGMTKYGVDARSHPDVDIRHLTEQQAIQIYWDLYWTKYRCESFALGLGECVFNCCVNAGWGRAERILRLPSKSGAQFLDGQKDFYRRLVAAKPRFKKFLNGWLNRTHALRRLIA